MTFTPWVNSQGGMTYSIRSSLAARDIGLAYEIWQESYKPEFDTYNWDTLEINVGILS